MKGVDHCMLRRLKIVVTSLLLVVFVSLFAFLVAIWIPVACSSASATPQLDQAERKWTRQNITSYRIEVLVVSSIWHAQSHQIVVNDNAVADSTAECIPAPMESALGAGCEVWAYTAEEYAVPGLFAKARSKVHSQQARWVKITYDPTYGFPRQISFDDPNIVDEDWTWRVTTFEVLK